MAKNKDRYFEALDMKKKQQQKLKCVLKRLSTDMKQELLAALLSELKGE